jgi:hypothetical protein
MCALDLALVTMSSTIQLNGRIQLVTMSSTIQLNDRIQLNQSAVLVGAHVVLPPIAVRALNPTLNPGSYT